MKSTVIAMLTGAVLASAAFLAAPAVVPFRAGAAPAESPAASADNKTKSLNGGESYKILSLIPFQNDATTQRMENALNKLAADGWRVKTGVGVALVLYR